MIQPQCKAMGCTNPTHYDNDFCPACLNEHNSSQEPAKRLSRKYPKYYRSTHGLNEIDVYAVHKIFSIQDSSGCIQHASKKLLLSGVRNGGKPKLQDISEARDSLDRWIELHKDISDE